MNDAATPYERLVLKQVDGIKRSSDISRAIHGGVANGATYKALRSLETKGYIVRDPTVAWSADWKWFRTDKRVGCEVQAVDAPRLFDA